MICKSRHPRPGDEVCWICGGPQKQQQQKTTTKSRIKRTAPRQAHVEYPGRTHGNEIISKGHHAAPNRKRLGRRWTSFGRPALCPTNPSMPCQTCIDRPEHIQHHAVQGCEPSTPAEASSLTMMSASRRSFCLAISSCTKLTIASSVGS